LLYTALFRDECVVGLFERVFKRRSQFGYTAENAEDGIHDKTSALKRENEQRLRGIFLTVSETQR